MTVLRFPKSTITSLQTAQILAEYDIFKALDSALPENDLSTFFGTYWEVIGAALHLEESHILLYSTLQCWLHPDCVTNQFPLHYGRLMSRGKYRFRTKIPLDLQPASELLCVCKDLTEMTR